MVRAVVMPELGRDDDLSLEWLERLADQRFVVERAIDLGGVEERHAAIDGLPKEGDHLLPRSRRRSVGHAHAHAAEPDGGNGESIGSQGSLVHCSFLSASLRGAGVVSSGALTTAPLETAPK